MLLGDTVAVQKVVMDFEKALWAAVKSVMDVIVMGCVFHWTQAIWRKVQDLGLTHVYTADEGTFSYIRRLMALPFIPFQEIPAVFQTLAVEAATEPLQELVGYISTNWITSTIFPPKDWSVYGEAVRTNNDVEGWHNALNRRASGRPRLPLYQLIELLHMEAKLVQLQMRLVADKKLARIQRKRYRGYQQKIFVLWGEYSNREKTVQQLLKGCSFLNDPVRQNLRNN